MKIRREDPALTVSGLRTRYVPKCRINQGLVSMAPWIDAVLLLILFVLFNGTLVLKPGVVVDIPVEPFRAGTSGGMLAVVLSVKGRIGEPARELVFFDDERFRLDRVDDLTRLKDAIRRRLDSQAGAPLVIHADAGVAQGTVMDLVSMASEAGVTRVNLAARGAAQ